MTGSELMKRTSVAGVGIPLALGIIYLGGWPLTSLMALVSGMAVRELFLLADRKEVRGFYWLGVPAAVILVLVAGQTRVFEEWAPFAVGILLALFFLAASMAVGRRGPEGRPLTATVVTVAGALWWGGGLSFFVFLRHYPDTLGSTVSDPQVQGTVLLAFALAVTWIADSAAYFIGSIFGKRKMAPLVSPGKTVEGGVAGLVAAVVVGALLGWLLLRIHPNSGVALLLGAGMGLAMSATVQLGDLIESLFKREAGVKDSGTLLPGHGGILDRFDALVFTVPLTYAMIRLLGLWI